jgi:hypothetical protein
MLLLVLAVAAALWGILAAMGDAAGAQGAKGVFLAALVCWALNFVALVVFLALAQLSATAVPPRESEPAATDAD